VDKSIFQGDTINTPSMLCVEDYIDALEWAESIGGLNGLIKKSQSNLKVLEKFVERNDWIKFLAEVSIY
jgi:phosphoserine aminotransferase